MPAKEEVLAPEDVEKAKKSAAAATKKRAAKPKELKLQRRGSGPKTDSIKPDPSVPYPEGLHGEEDQLYSPSGFAAVIPEGTEISPFTDDQLFAIDHTKIEGLPFDTVAGRNLPKKRLYCVKAIHKDGRLVQLPFEQQIQNNAGGDEEDAIGLRRYQRKGIRLLFDFETFLPVYCAAWDCWAKATVEGRSVGFCSDKHARHTLPNRYKDASSIVSGLQGIGVTTSRTWSA